MPQLSFLDNTELAVEDFAQLAFHAFSQSHSGNDRLAYFASYSFCPAINEEQKDVVEQIISAPESVFTAAYNYAVNVRQNQHLIYEADGKSQQDKLRAMVDNARNGIIALNWVDHPQHRQDLTRSHRDNPGRFHAPEAAAWLLEIGSQGYQAGVQNATTAQLIIN